MKIKLFFTVLMLVLGSVTTTYASFPVQTKTMTTTNNVNVTETNEDELTSPAVLAGSKSQIAALLLCWLVGIIGIHRFYLGYTWQGIVQILTLGGLGIWTLIDFIRIITGSLQPKNGNYDKTF